MSWKTSSRISGGCGWWRRRPARSCRRTLIPAREDNDEKLPSWSGTPLDPENLGAYLEREVRFCQIGDPKRLEAVLVIDQSDRNIIGDKPPVDIKLEGFPATTLHTYITEIAEEELKVSPNRLATSKGGELPSKADPHSGVERPMSTSYQARAPIDDPDGSFRLGIRGQARVYTKWLSIGARLWRLHQPHVQLQDVEPGVRGQRSGVRGQSVRKC